MNYSGYPYNYVQCPFLPLSTKTLNDSELSNAGWNMMSGYNREYFSHVLGFCLYHLVRVAPLSYSTHFEGDKIIEISVLKLICQWPNSKCRLKLEWISTQNNGSKSYEFKVIKKVVVNLVLFQLNFK